MRAGVPEGARLLALSPGTKVPLPGSHGHKEAIPAEEFLWEGNYGIVLDGQFLVVDYDRPVPNDADWTDGNILPHTWSQQTRRGTHILYSVPNGWGADLKNVKFPYGDIKIHGYIVGPGSVIDDVIYTKPSVDNRVVPAPQWLLDYVEATRTSVRLDSLADQDFIYDGQGRDDTLTKFAGLFRRVGLSEAGIAKGLAAVNDSVIDPPKTRSAILRIARSAAKYEITAGVGALAPENLRSAADISFVGDPIKWHVWGFVPQRELVMIFGPGGVGKSSWGSWLAAEVTKKGRSFGGAFVEEPFHRFAWRSVLGGARRDLLFGVDNASSISLPSDASALADLIAEAKLDVFYFDSIYSHFDNVEGLNAAERARKSLAPLSEIAQQLGTTIVAVFHENKAGDYLGSVEMVNVARYVLRARREKGRPLYVGVTKTNLIDPGTTMVFSGHEMAASDPETGEVQYQENREGILVPATLVVLQREADIASDSISLNEIEGADEDDLGLPATFLLEEALRAHPDWSNARLAEETGLSESHVRRTAAEVRRTLGMVSHTVSLMGTFTKGTADETTSLGDQHE